MMKSITVLDRLYKVERDYTIIYSKEGITFDSETNVSQLRKLYSPLKLRHIDNAPTWIKKAFGVEQVMN